jgi:hypothetical protein
MTPSRPGARAHTPAAPSTLAFDLLCQASLVCAARVHVPSARTSADAERLAAAQREIRCAAYLISGRLPTEGRQRAQNSPWERLFESPVPPSGTVDEILALLEHAQDTIAYLLSVRDPTEDEYLASLHVGFARHELTCASS